MKELIDRGKFGDLPNGTKVLFIPAGPLFSRNKIEPVPGKILRSGRFPSAVFSHFEPTRSYYVRRIFLCGRRNRVQYIPSYRILAAIGVNHGKDD